MHIAYKQRILRILLCKKSKMFTCQDVFFNKKSSLNLCKKNANFPLHKIFIYCSIFCSICVAPATPLFLKFATFLRLCFITLKNFMSKKCYSKTYTHFSRHICILTNTYSCLNVRLSKTIQKNGKF